MIRGTTEQFKFKLPYPKDKFKDITAKFWQPNNNAFVPIYKGSDDCFTTDKPNVVCISLTVGETAKFSDKFRGKVQMKAEHKENGSTYATFPQTFSVYPMADDIIGDEGTAQVVDGWVIFDGQPIAVSEEGDTNG